MVIDASVWVSGFLPVEAAHRASRSWLQVQTEQHASLVVPTLVLAEVAGAIGRRTGDSRRGIYAMERLIAMPGIQVYPVDRRLGIAAARIAARAQLRGADAVYAALARMLRVPLVTLDQEMLSRARPFVQTFEPA